jgi:hypothetical protein
MTSKQSSTQPEAEARTKSYGKTMLAWAAGFGVVGMILANPFAGLNEQRAGNIVLAILIGGFIGFVRTADKRREFVYIVAIGRAARGALRGPILLVAVGMIAELGALLLAQAPSPIADLFSWKWWIGSMVVTGALSAGGLLAGKQPGQVLPYARNAGEGFFDGMAFALIYWLVTYTGPKPWTVQPPELIHLGREIGLAAVAGGVAAAILAVIREAIRRQFVSKRGVDVGLPSLVDCVVLLCIGAWFLCVDPLPGLSTIAGWCAILLGAIALTRAIRAFAPAS